MSGEGLSYGSLRPDFSTPLHLYYEKIETSLTSGKSTQNALILSPYRNAPKFSLNRPKLSFRSWRCIILASRSAMLSLSSAKAGSNEASGSSWLMPLLPAVGVVWEARRLVREGGRSGVVGRDGCRGWVWEEVCW